MELTAMFGSIGLCVGAIVAAAVIYFVVTAIKGTSGKKTCGVRPATSHR